MDKSCYATPHIPGYLLVRRSSGYMAQIDASSIIAYDVNSLGWVSIQFERNGESIEISLAEDITLDKVLEEVGKALKMGKEAGK